MSARVTDHAFVHRPHRTVIALSIPVTLSIIAEPITAMVDTAFVARLGTNPLAALGVGASALSVILWAFTFLAISTQTGVAQALGDNNPRRAAEITGLALIMGAIGSLLLMLVVLPASATLARLLGAAGEVNTIAEAYIRIRLLGIPAVLLTMIGFGVLRGLQDMRTPMWIAIAINMMNIVLDAPLVFGFGPVPMMGASGAALASVISQWVGLALVLHSVFRRLGFVPHTHWPDVLALLRVGRDLLVRTGMLTLFLLLATRVANQIGPEAGAANQAIRSVWVFFSFFMEGFAVTAQSLVGYFLGAGRVNLARHASAITTLWSLGIGIVLTGLMLIGTALVAATFVPAEAVDVFIPAWHIAVLALPFTALAFVTDGIHWGAGDYAYMRNGMIVATVSSAVALFLIDLHLPHALLLVWAATMLWVAVRATFGVMRVWPGVGRAPLRTAPRNRTEVSAPTA